MKNKFTFLVLFVIMAVVQWLVPFHMIRENRGMLLTGKEYKFRLTPVDPEDPFRGRYLDLNYDISWFKVAPPVMWQTGETVYVVLEQDDQGFARIHRLSKETPGQEEDFVESRIRSVIGEDTSSVFIEYPLDRYYINEKMAGPIQEMLFENQRDTSKINYALVRVQAGRAILEEVYLDEIPVSEWIQKLPAK